LKIFKEDGGNQNSEIFLSQVLAFFSQTQARREA